MEIIFFLWHLISVALSDRGGFENSLMHLRTDSNSQKMLCTESCARERNEFHIMMLQLYIVTALVLLFPTVPSPTNGLRIFGVHPEGFGIQVLDVDEY